MKGIRAASFFFALVSLTLVSCSPNYSREDWTGFISKSETLRFMAVASCGTPDFLNPVSADAAFYSVRRLEPVKAKASTYSAELVGADGVRRGTFFISQRWSHSGTQVPSASANDGNTFCNVLAELPMGRDGRQPYYVEPEAGKTAQYNALAVVTPLSIMLCVVVGAVLALSFWGFEHKELWAKWAGTLVGILAVSAGLYAFYVEIPWSNYQDALKYRNFFDQLARNASGELLPISFPQLAYLVAGPTHPRLTQFSFDTFAWVSVGLIGWWVLVSSPFVVMGIYWLAVPLPLEELHERTLREGRAPTAAEITAAVLGACTGKAAWQHRIMQRKADAFAKNLNAIARHL